MDGAGCNQGSLPVGAKGFCWVQRPSSRGKNICTGRRLILFGDATWQLYSVSHVLESPHRTTTTRSTCASHSATCFLQRDLHPRQDDYFLRGIVFVEKAIFACPLPGKAIKTLLRVGSVCAGMD